MATLVFNNPMCKRLLRVFFSRSHLHLNNLVCRRLRILLRTTTLVPNSVLTDDIVNIYIRTHEGIDKNKDFVRSLHVQYKIYKCQYLNERLLQRKIKFAGKKK